MGCGFSYPNTRRHRIGPNYLQPRVNQPQSVPGRSPDEFPVGEIGHPHRAYFSGLLRRAPYSLAAIGDVGSDTGGH